MSEKVVLVVDDMGTVRSVIAHHLRSAGYKAIEAESGLVALQIAVRDPVDLIILDVMMPKVDGFTVLDRLRKSEKTANLPVIMCTAKGQREDVVQAMHVGATDYIVKPFSKQVLLEKVKKLIGEAAPAEAPKKKKQAKAEPGEAIPPKPKKPIEPADAGEPGAETPPPE